MRDRFLSTGMSLWCMQGPCAYVVFALHSKLCWRGVARRGGLVAKRSVSLGSPPSLRFLGLGSPPPSFPFFFFFLYFLYFIYLFILFCFFSWGLFILLPLGFWPQCDGCYSGGLGAGGSWLGCGLVGLWVFFRLGVYCGCSPLAHGHPTFTFDAGVKQKLPEIKINYNINIDTEGLYCLIPVLLFNAITWPKITIKIAQKVISWL